MNTTRTSAGGHGAPRHTQPTPSSITSHAATRCRAVPPSMQARAAQATACMPPTPRPPPPQPVRHSTQHRPVRYRWTRPPLRLPRPRAPLPLRRPQQAPRQHRHPPSRQRRLPQARQRRHPRRWRRHQPHRCRHRGSDAPRPHCRRYEQTSTRCCERACSVRKPHPPTRTGLYTQDTRVADALGQTPCRCRRRRRLYR